MIVCHSGGSGRQDVTENRLQVVEATNPETLDIKELANKDCKAVQMATPDNSVRLWQQMAWLIDKTLQAAS